MSRYDIRALYQRHLRCPNCNNIITLWSKKNRIRPKGHIKTMYCYYCNELVDCVEIREPNFWEDQEEIENANEKVDDIDTENKE